MTTFRFLALTLVAASCLAVGAQAQKLQTLDIPDEISAELDGESMDFELSSPETAVIEVTLTSDEFDPFLELLDAEGNTVAENDDGGEDTSSVLSFLAQADTAYTIRARSYAEGASGEFTLVVSDKGANELAIGQPVTTDLEGKSEFFIFEGKEDDEVDFVVEVEDYDTILSVTDAYGNALISSDDAEGRNPFISDFLLPEDGIYILNLTAYFDEAATEPIELSVRPTTIQDIVFDEALTSEKETSYLRLEVEADTTYRIEVRATVPTNFNVEIRPRTSDFSEVSSNSYGVTTLAFEFTPLTDGVYKLTIGGISTNYEVMPYTTTVTEVK